MFYNFGSWHFFRSTFISARKSILNRIQTKETDLSPLPPVEKNINFFPNLW